MVRLLPKVLWRKFKFKGIALSVFVMFAEAGSFKEPPPNTTKRPGRGKSLHCLINSVTVRVTSCKNYRLQNVEAACYLFVA